MSKERARRRAEEKARKRAPKRPHDTGDSTSPGTGATGASKRKVAQRSAREQRRRRRLIGVVMVWLAANALIFLLTDTWGARWLGLTVTTILVPVVVWLLWDPEGRVDL